MKMSTRTSSSLTHPAWLAAACLVLGLTACDDTDVVVQDPNAEAPSLSAQTTGVADDGTQIIFAGAHRAQAPTAPRPSVAARDDEHLIREPNVPDPESGEFTLEEAVVGLPIDGSLILELGTTFGTVLCELYADRAPNTVANFVGLARGLRPWWDARAGEWRTEPYYERLTFHRVIPGYLIQGGDYLADGSGTVGYTIEDEPHDTLAHDRAGQLVMASADGANSAGAQFFISDGPAPQLDGEGYTIFGQCRPEHIISQLARVPQRPESNNAPLSELRFRRVMIRRVVGGLAEAQPTQPQLPAGEPETPRGASRDPSEVRRRYDPHQYGEPSPFPNGHRGPPSIPRTPRNDSRGGAQ